MKLSDFDYDLPEDRIAAYPLPERSQSRLLVLDRAKQTLIHRHFVDLVDYVVPGDLIVFNNSRVMKARLFGQKETGGKVEILIERLLSDHQALAHIKSRRLKPGAKITLENGEKLEVLGQTDHLYSLQLLSEQSFKSLLNEVGHIPLPPYIKRPDESSDLERYQTVYSLPEGSVAAPTAGLHFDSTLLNTLSQKGVRFAYVTLHVGAGTFQPVKTEEIHQHQMHSEYIELPAETVQAILEAKSQGKRVISIGTTATRVLESVAATGPLRPFFGETRLFIYPPYAFQIVDVLITNFHLPQSSLLMLVAAFAGYDCMRRAYTEAIQLGYRFFSYGDAMLVL